MEHAPEFATGDDEPPGNSSVALVEAEPSGRYSLSTAAFSLPLRGNRFPQSGPVREFRKRFFPRASLSDWNNWHWQLQNSLRTTEAISAVVPLTTDEEAAITGCGSPNAGLPVAITPYYASLINPFDPADPIRRAIIPSCAEFASNPGESGDPLGEESQSPTLGLVHRYPDRVLFLATEYCASYCRYCTRSRLVGQSERQRYRFEQWQKALDYIAATPSIRDVVLSGGDPLTLPDEALEWLLMSLRAIKHVEVIRIGSKAPAVLPMRITPALTKLIRKHHPVWMSLHFTHPAELTPETAEACARLADAGAPLGSQTVLLRGINDDAGTLRTLMTGLMKIRVRPYYLYQCDPIAGSAHLRTPVEKGVEMIEALRGHVSGYAVPQYVIDAPGGGGKIPLLPKYRLSCQDGDLSLRNYQGKVFHYPDLIV
ncbi:MAG: KamA family radical SAM protein [Planctomycetota bacterium]|nr:KamA family radical SAM protein [Planctomycetota bacterium]